MVKTFFTIAAVTALLSGQSLGQSIGKPIFPGVNVIHSDVDSSYCLAAVTKPLRKTDSTGVTLQSCLGIEDPRKALVWTFSDGQLKIYDDRCLHVPSNAKAGERVLVKICDGSKNQKWQYNQDFKTFASDSGFCMYVPPDNIVYEGVWVQVWRCPTAAEKLINTGVLWTVKSKEYVDVSGSATY